MEATPVPTKVRVRVPLLVMMSSVSWACRHCVPQRRADTGQGTRRAPSWSRGRHVLELRLL